MKNTIITKPKEAIENKQADSDLNDPRPPELGGRKGPEPTRFGDWELKGKCVDF